MKANSATVLTDQLDYLKLPFIKAHYSELAREAASQNWDHQEYLRRLIDGEFGQRQQRRIERRVKAARFPVLKTLEQFRWDYPKRINRVQVQNLFRLEFVPRRPTPFSWVRLVPAKRTWRRLWVTPRVWRATRSSSPMRLPSSTISRRHREPAH